MRRAHQLYIPFRRSQQKSGTVWDVVIVESGLCDNYIEGVREYFDPEALQQSLEMFEGVPVYAFSFDETRFDHMPEEPWEAGGKYGVVQNTVGYIKNVKWGKSPEGKDAILGQLHFIDTGQEVAAVLRQTIGDGDLKDFAGLSINYNMTGNLEERDGQPVFAETIEQVHSVDVVSHPAAGGQFLRMVAAQRRGGEKMERLIRLLTALASSRRAAGKDWVRRLMSVDSKSEEQVMAIAEEVIAEVQQEEAVSANAVLTGQLNEIMAAIKAGELEGAVQKLDAIIADLMKAEAPAAGAPAAEAQSEEIIPDPAIKLPPEVAAQIAQLTKTVSTLNAIATGQKIETDVAASALPEPTKALLSQRLKQSMAVYDKKAVSDAIAAEQNHLSALAEAGVIRAGQSTSGTFVSNRQTDERNFLAFEGLFLGEDQRDENNKPVRAFQSLREAYAAYTGESIETDRRKIWRAMNERGSYSSLDRGGQLRKGARGVQSFRERRRVQALTSASWAEVFADVMHNAMLKEYAATWLNDWRKVVEVTTLADLNAHYFTRTGGSYGAVRSVAEGVTYEELTDPSDEQISMTAVKYGGLAVITEEMVLKDKLREIQKIPAKLARSIAQDIYREVFDLPVTNAAIYDSVTLIHAGTHKNGNASSGTTLTAAMATTARHAMMNQTAYGDSRHVLGMDNLLKYFLVPIELENIAKSLTEQDRLIQAAATSGEYGAGSFLPDAPASNLHAGASYIVVPHWTDADAWYACADPSLVPWCMIGFLNGDETPEILTENAQSGSAFYADKKVFKVRQWRKTVASDYRGIYGEVP